MPAIALDSPDAELLARFHSGDDAALGALYERYEGPVFRFLLGILRDHHRAEDVLQETFVQALGNADGLDPGKFRGWLFTVAHQQAMLLLRKEKRAPSPSGDGLLGLLDSSENHADRAGRIDDLRAVGELLELLPAGQQAVIRLRVFEGLTFREVSEKLGCPLNTALGRMHDGLRTLRNLWEGRVRA